MTGFSDAEGCFHLSILKRSEPKTGWQVRLEFQISLHIKDITLLETFRSFFGVGSLYNSGSMAYFRVISIKDLTIIVNHFKDFPLKSQKAADFLLFEKAFDLIKLKKHLEGLEGLEQLVAIKASMNHGLSDQLQKGFPNTRAAKRARISIGKIEQVQWMAGFASGDGCFEIYINKKESTRSKHYIKLSFSLTQHARDTELMRRCIDFFQAGSVIQNQNSSVFRISKFEDLFYKVLPLFKEAQILGNKAKDFND